MDICPATQTALQGADYLDSSMAGACRYDAETWLSPGGYKVLANLLVPWRIVVAKVIGATMQLLPRPNKV